MAQAQTPSIGDVPDVWLDNASTVEGAGKAAGLGVMRTLIRVMMTPDVDASISELDRKILGGKGRRDR